MAIKRQVSAFPLLDLYTTVLKYFIRKITKKKLYIEGENEMSFTTSDIKDVVKLCIGADYGGQDRCNSLPEKKTLGGGTVKKKIYIIKKSIFFPYSSKLKEHKHIIREVRTF